MMVGIVAGLLVAARFVSIALPERTGRVDPHVNLEDIQARQIAARQWQQQAGAFLAVTEGEVSRTEERMREATALATAAGLFAGSESLNHRMPMNVGSLLSGIESAGLMPPGMQLLGGGQGEVESPRGRLFVRYRPEPLGVEVVSLGKERLDGPALLLRVPDDAGTEDGVRLYVATRLEEITIPAPFVHEAEVIALGFSPEPLRAARLPTSDAGK